ncbi:phosphoribosylformylglycinamidine synthase-like [Haliotis rufescens]|uniref:phosphoribosylformylglycinamidine synthase-like n=1 Tax=Haliotis rufescens TaxID=6454 RepID=UPI001EB08BBE|nr:phosphoribosylformylglycinamidine synthase-like [Haliotis rufescens]XP_048244279.1 phosphoribosylformylglycinamidine synthase-like [Haliotis rufescens]XP_048244280.1 phosphoribosylformylglycinamidine synthase-like [Haliotis rufescens]XP_048244281.1 phosphoribosylformylglycinamidine synthase-like [Haliotis rufescens]XP_048244282.1 phosphoribosylformylglycinamidine synthase-like [Haliotis rufescens]XP_048244283.1 phosphoribosylformylglycinamidine synthase-like [Haliotis rufescens]XP_04824428
MPGVLRYFRCPGLNQGAAEVTTAKINKVLQGTLVKTIDTETCIYVQNDGIALDPEEERKLQWIFSIPFQAHKLQTTSSLHDSPSTLLLEVGPRLNFSTAFSTNAVSICQSVGLSKISRIEESTRYLITFTSDTKPSTAEEDLILSQLYDRMTQCRYLKPLESFKLSVRTEPVFEVDIMGRGRSALEEANKELGLAFDDWDLDYYTDLFVDKVKRNPTSVECFDLAQSNSEHSRHWFFKGRMVIDGEEMNRSLFKMIMDTQLSSNKNNVIKFNDNSSGINGHPVTCLAPADPTAPSRMVKKENILQHVIFTAETHNFPTGVAPFPGATTGTGGRIRDVQSTGRGAHVVAGTAGYCFGNLHIPGYKLPWEDEQVKYPPNFAPPLEVAVEASNGASDYGNKFGEPVLAGFARSFGMILPEGERREYIKPIMFSGGIGAMDGRHVHKAETEKGMKVVKIGGPVFRIGVGGGAASSVHVQGDNKADLDFGAVQRGDAEMEQKLNRLIRGCVELETRNPICSIHDQGAGGNGNVLKEICEPSGAIIRADDFQLGDPTLSILELWGAEYQESNAILVRPKDVECLKQLGQRERCPVCFVGTITGTGRIQLQDFSSRSGEDTPESKMAKTDAVLPVDLELEHVLGSMPRKVFKLEHMTPVLTPIKLPDNLLVRDALERVLRLPSVASKRYLTNKVDRSVTGLIAQQQCVGPLHTPLADVAVTATSYFDAVGAATAIGEQPIKGLINPEAGARMAVAESLTNLMFASVTDLKDIKCSGNWMWAAKLPGEGAALVDACKAMCDLMGKIGIAVDGGKDSLSMAARVGDETVKAPGTLVISSYAACPDVTRTVTPDLKCLGGEGTLLYVNLSSSVTLGGSALAQCYNQIGDDVSDVLQPELLVSAFRVMQTLLEERLVTAGHDVSDGGLITCLLEMAFAGNCGIDVSLHTLEDEDEIVDFLFCEDLGVILEVRTGDEEEVIEMFDDENVPCVPIGRSKALSDRVVISVNDEEVLIESTMVLRDIWEETSFQLERLQANPHMVQQEQEGLKSRRFPPYQLPFCPDDDIKINKELDQLPMVAVLREEGSNGDREMCAAFTSAGFEVWDINMQDLQDGKVDLDTFRGLAFVGGFSYADVLGSAKGWAAAALFNPTIKEQFERFRQRPDTFSLGVCNGCQLMALLGWVAPDPSEVGLSEQGLLLDHNDSERYESRFVTVQVQDSPAVMLKGMEGTTFGMWVSHGEGKMVFKTDGLHHDILSNNLAPVRYVNDDGEVTTNYPLNPNGSPDGIAAVCSQDGRHLAIMPHPERCFLTWQCPWMPYEWREDNTYSPWIRMFLNAYNWCVQ